MVLWLTRTSMAEVPSVPSLRNLVANTVMSKSRRNSIENQNPIQRNFSTKSFLKYDSAKEEAPIRKCETVIAFSGKVTNPVWKLQHFSVTQISREIEFGQDRISESAISTHSEALNFDFHAFFTFFKG